jgi:hypothetical protein
VGKDKNLNGLLRLVFEPTRALHSCTLLVQVINSLFVWLVADGWCWFVLREKYCWLIVSGWFVLREKYCWLVADKPSEQAARCPRSFFLKKWRFQLSVVTQAAKQERSNQAAW